MTSQSHWIQPPRFAVWLLTLFAFDDKAESILGDLLEEFTLLASKSGAPFARRWYWRQSLKTVLQLAVLGFRTAPWLITAAVVGGFFLRSVVSRLVEPTIFAVIEKYQITRASFQHVCVPGNHWDRSRTPHHIPIDWFHGCARGQRKGNGGHDDTGSCLRCDDGCRSPGNGDALGVRYNSVEADVVFL